MFYLPEGILRFLLLIGGLHGLVFAIFLFIIKRKNVHGRILALLVFVWSVSALARAYQGSQIYLDNPHLMNVLPVFALFWYPIMFLYVRYLISGSKKFKPLDYLHFLPALIRTLAFIPFFALSAEEKLALYHESDNIWFIFDQLVNFTIVIQGIVYTYLVVRRINIYEAMIKDMFSNVDRILLRWLRTLVLLGFSGFIFGVVASVAAGLFSFDISILWDILYLVLIFTIYYIGYKALKFPELLKYTSKIRDIAPGPQNIFSTQDNTKNVDQIALKKLKDYLHDEKPYLDPDLNLQSLASSLELTRHQLSMLINENFNKKFYDMIHEYRVTEVVERLQSPESENFTIETIAYESGFNSKATFHRVFKKVTGKTPSLYIKNLQSA